MLSVPCPVERSGSRPFYIGLYFLSREGKMEGGWYPFGWNLMIGLVPKPGVFEIADEDGMTIYIGDAENLRLCFERLLSEPDFEEIRQHAEMCHVEYRIDNQSQSQLKRMLFRDIFGHDPLFNREHTFN